MFKSWYWDGDENHDLITERLIKTKELCFRNQRKRTYGDKLFLSVW